MTNNLTFIIANKKGRICWKEGSLDPYTFEANFLSERGIPDSENIPDYIINKGFRLIEQITNEMLEERMNIWTDPLRIIEINKQGLRVSNNLAFTHNCYEYQKSKKLGYIFWLDEGSIKNLKRAEIEYCLIDKK